MRHANPVRARAYLTIAVVLYAAFHLAWEYLNGGVQSHHLLNRPDLPAISNWWGLLVLPVLAWLLIARMQARDAADSHAGIARPTVRVLLAAFLYGAGLATSFSLGYEAVTSAMFLGMFALAVALPIFRPEYVLGFVLGMTLTFGAVLPTLVAGVFALLSGVLHPVARFLVKAVVRLASRARGRASAETAPADTSGVA